MSSWVAVQASKDVVLDALNFEETGEEVQPGAGRRTWSCAVLPGGWCVVFAEDFDWATPERVRGLSRLGMTLGCQFEDQVDMTCAAFAARDGEELWRVFHDNTESHYRLDVTGAPPAAFDEIRQGLFREQDEDGGEESSTDFVHDVPLELAKSVCGYRHDDYDGPFVRLRTCGAPAVQAPRRRPGLLAKLLAPLRPRD